MLRDRVVLAPLGIRLSCVYQSLCCYRYDLQIRYLPEDFMESLKEDRTTLLYFYQQVKSTPVSQNTLNAECIHSLQGRWQNETQP